MFKRIIIVCLFLMALTGCVQSQATQPTFTPQPAKPAVATPAIELLPEKITSQALAGNLLGDPTERTAYVLLPPGYAASEKRYPVVYVMPWGNGEPSANAWGFKGAMESPV
ncbi:MAG: hypothetical protein HXY20_15430 [Acidobacteria bacterium]|nr:hypothetical protein [Acidobacteriota bacterium]